MRLNLAVALAGVVVAVLLALFVVPNSDDGTRPLPARIDPRLPDLAVAPLSGITGLSPAAGREPSASA